MDGILSYLRKPKVEKESRSALGTTMLCCCLLSMLKANPQIISGVQNGEGMETKPVKFGENQILSYRISRTNREIFAAFDDHNEPPKRPLMAETKKAFCGHFINTVGGR